ncbi:MAG: Uma2 family endonuclease, partial [Anaerolineae bacterium]|nr:Uma2 family endonuclease [Anaerolineae bacterium]MDW8171723.1 Uma2 family endonuclease [Anaerolineae bacterium]
VNGERYAPDVAFISRQRQPELAREGYNPNPPDLAIEVDFPSSPATQRHLRFKLSNYLAAGTTVWIVVPELRHVEVYAPGQAPRIYREDESIALAGPLAGLVVAVNDIFPPAKAES